MDVRSNRDFKVAEYPANLNVSAGDPALLPDAREAMLRQRDAEDEDSAAARRPRHQAAEARGKGLKRRDLRALQTLAQVRDNWEPFESGSGAGRRAGRGDRRPVTWNMGLARLIDKAWKGISPTRCFWTSRPAGCRYPRRSPGTEPARSRLPRPGRRVATSGPGHWAHARAGCDQRRLAAVTQMARLRSIRGASGRDNRQDRPYEVVEPARAAGHDGPGPSPRPPTRAGSSGPGTAAIVRPSP
jgi:hypothetical protein